MSEFRMNLPRDVAFILAKMKESGFVAHVVGGSVRDSLIGRELGDFDITTNALPEETKSVFDGYRIIETGIKHGTVTLVLEGVPYEITTYRVDGDYKDNRHPDNVTFTDRLEEDLMRRDFTVNAMAYSPDIGLSDPFGGRGDAENKLIRAVGDPYKRFDEDALRILRALRFASVLGFEIEEMTAKAIRERGHLLSAISKERIYTELKKLVIGKDAPRILTSYSEVIAPLLSGLSITALPDSELFDRAEMHTRFAALFYLNSENPKEHSELAFTELKTDKLTRSGVYDALCAFDTIDFTTERAVLRALADHGETVVRDVLALGVLLGRYSDMETKMLDLVLESLKPYTVSALALRGGDIAALGYRGEAIGETLKKLLYAVIDGEVENEKSELIAYLVETKK